MRIEYLEIVTPDVEAVCDSYAAAQGIEFGEPIQALGFARTADLLGGGRIGVRAPMHETETPVVRPYWFVADIEAAVAESVARGAEVMHPPMEIPDQGTFAILMHGGIQTAYWQN